MSELLMFNKETREMRFISQHDHQKIDSLKAEGWTPNPTMVQMHNPRLNKFEAVMVQECKQWEDKGYYANPTMIYHPKDGTKMVSGEDAKMALNKGWYASPAHFPGNEEGQLKTLVLKEAS